MDITPPVNRITPHKICLCSLIEYYLYSTTITFNQRRSLSLILIKHIKRASNYSEPSLKEFIETDLKSKLSDNFINNELIERLTFESIDDIHQFITDLNQLFVKNNHGDDSDDDNDDDNEHDEKYLESNSILGSFVQKIILNYNQTMFDGLSDVYHETISYIQEYNSNNNIINNGDINYNNPILLSKSSFLSPFDEERFICEEIIRVNNLIGKENPLIIKQRIEELRGLLPDANKCIYLSFLNHLNHMEFDGALEELHRYFDYCNSSDRHNATGGNVDNLNTLLPYAVLNLSKLHFQFGHYEEAYMFLQETIRIAQERSDHSCLALALNLLNKLLDPSVLQTIDSSDLLQSLLDSQSQLEILQSSTKKSEQLEMTSLSSLNYMSQSKYNLINYPSNNNNNSNNNNTVISSAKNETQYNSKSFFNDVFYPLQKSHQMSRDSNKTLNQMKASVWEILGNYDLAQYYSDLSLRFDNRGQLSNLVRSRHPNNNDQTIDDILSYTKMALLSSKRGHFQDAIQSLNDCIAKFPYHTHIQNSPLSFVLVSVIFDHARMSRNFTICQRSIETLLGILNKRAPEDNSAGGWSEILQTSERVAEYYIDMNMPDNAHSFLSAMIKTATLYGQQQYLPSFYILKATLYSKEDSQDEGCGSDWLKSGAISNTLNSLSLTEPSHSVNPTLTCKANLLLIQIYLQSNDFQKAIELLTVTIPLVLKDLNLLTQSYLLFSKSLLNLWLQQQHPPSKNNNQISNTNIISQKEREKIKYYLDMTEENAIILTNQKILQQVYYLDSIYYHSIGDVEKRNEYATKFKLMTLTTQPTVLTSNTPMKNNHNSLLDVSNE